MSDIIKQAEQWRETLSKLAEGWGDTWSVNYIEGEFTDSGKDEYQGQIHVNEDIDIDTSGFNYPLGVPDDEGFAALLCHLYNDSWSIMDKLMDEVKRLQELVDICDEMDKHRELYGDTR